MNQNLIAQAPVTNPSLGPRLQGILAGADPGTVFLQVLMPNLIGLALLIGVIIFIFIFIIGAIQWIFSGGDKAGLEAARGKLANGLVGIVILFSTFAVAKLIETFFGVNILTLDIGPLKIR